MHTQMALNSWCTYHAEPSEGSELEKAAYALNTKQKVVKLIGQWVALYGLVLKDDQIVQDFLEVSGADITTKENHVCEH